MATRPKKRELRDDEERILHFEWHASHFRSVDNFLPPLPLNSNFMYGMAEDDFHTATIRFAILRKFIMGNEPVRLDRVAVAMENRSVGEQPNLVANLAYIRETYKTLTASTMRVGIDRTLLERDDLYENIVNGLMLHSDVERRDLFDQIHIGTIHREALHQRDLRKAVLEMLATVEEGREQGYLDIPPPYRRIWEPKPRPQS